LPSRNQQQTGWQIAWKKINKRWAVVLALGLAGLFATAQLLFAGWAHCAMAWITQQPCVRQPLHEADASRVHDTGALRERLDADSCAACHAQQVADWLGSHHEQAMQVANAATVLGDFQNATFNDGAVTSRFFQRDDQWIVHTVGEDGNYADFTVRYTFGITPLQQYLLELPQGRLQAFTVAWDTREDRWFSLYPGETFAPDDRLHWTSRSFTANSSCLDCHVTGLQLGYDPASDSYQTTWDAVNVGCQACHRVTEQHIVWAQTLPQPLARDHVNIGIEYQSLSPQEQVDGCARCHARRTPIRAAQSSSSHPNLGSGSPSGARAGSPGSLEGATPAGGYTDRWGEASFLDDYMPELLHAGYYHADGQMLDEVFNYGSYLQSKMYAAGLSCTTCHDPHTLQLRLPGNQLCASCHQLNAPTAAYPTLKAQEYDSPAHHFHEAGAPGSFCVDCHMPTTTYMVVDPRHDHSFSIPRPDLTLQWGTPNTCAQCHKLSRGPDSVNGDGEAAAGASSPDSAEAAAWAARAMDEWYGPQWRQRPSLAGLMTLARQGDAAAAEPLLTVIEDPAQPAIVRATAAELTALLPDPYRASVLTQLAPLATDASPLVRIGVIRALAELPEASKMPLLAPLLADPVRAVRIEAIRALVATPLGDALLESVFTPTERQDFDAALSDYIAAQTALADHPEGYLNLGNLYTQLGRDPARDPANDADLAEAAYLMAVERGWNFPPAYTALATFYYRQGRVQEAEDTLRGAVQRLPQRGEPHYSLGLFLVQQQRPQEAAASLAMAAELMPTQPRVYYNYGLLLNQLGRSAEAEAALLHAYALEPASADILLALATFYREQRQWQTALSYAEELARLRPQQYQELLNSLRRESGQ
jgi:predicted CXXCH cytochrome family protein